MTTYEYFLDKNKHNAYKLAMCIRLNDGSVRSYTYRQLFELADMFADALLHVEIDPGDRVAIVAENSPEWCAAYLAIAKVRATSVLIDVSLDQSELCKLLEKSKIRCIFSTQKTFQKLGTFKDVPMLDILNNANAFDGYSLAPCAVKTTDGNENASTIIFSSGTTKTASGIMHRHESLVNTTQMVIDCCNLQLDSRFLAILPNSHIYGLICQITGAMLLESSICFLEGLSGESLNGAFQEYKPTIFPGVPKVFELLKSQIMYKINSDPKTRKLFKTFFPICLSMRKKTGVNLGKTLFKAIHDGFGSHIKVLCSAGAPLSAETADFFYGTGFDILITYGATETNIPTIGNYGKVITTDTCGRPYPAVSVMLSDDGEILVKSPYMMLGYFDDEEATLNAYNEDGWFKTGDLGSLDPATGCIKMLGRCKDNIVLSTGKKVAPDDIENVYAGIDGVKELVVCGVSVADGGYDEAHAFVIAEPSKVESVLDCLKRKSASMPHTMKLADIHFLNEIPKTSLQKPKRYLLRQLVKQETPAVAAPTSRPIEMDINLIVRTAVAKIADVDVSTVLPDTKLFKELAIDSLGSIELCCELEAKCNINADIACLLHKEMTVSELIDYVSIPADNVKKSFLQRYPMEKSRHDYNIFRFIQNVLHGIYSIKVENEKVIPENSGYIICSNHVSNFDYLFLTFNFKWERFSHFCCMAKKELFSKVPYSKTITKIAGMVPVDRSGFANDSFSAVSSKLKECWGVLIHPEGTRSENGEMSAFKKGAALLSIEANVPIIPAYIKGGYEIYPKSKKLPNLFNWKEKKKYRVEVKYGEPISPKGLSADELIKKVELSVMHLKNGIKIVSTSV